MKIVTDSSVMFSMEEGARRGMAVLPLVVAIDGQSWLEYEDVSAEEFLAKVRAGALPQSASPPPALTLKAYDTDEEVIHLAMADGLSGAYEVACGLVKQARRPDRVHVVNTRTLCVPHRVLACTAVRLAEQGTDAKAVLETLHAQIATAHSYLIPEDFDYLRRGGRLTPLAATFAHLVKAFPVMKQTDDGTRLEKMKVALVRESRQRHRRRPGGSGRGRWLLPGREPCGQPCAGRRGVRYAVRALSGMPPRRLRPGPRVHHAGRPRLPRHTSCRPGSLSRSRFGLTEGPGMRGCGPLGADARSGCSPAEPRPAR